jgi:hypothetical protein
MKLVIGYCLVLLFSFTACKQSKNESKAIVSASSQLKFSSFGDKITEVNAMSSQEMLAEFENMHFGDTSLVKFSATIKEVCAKKGCWMKLALGATAETMVRFKDYGFFIPLDAKGKEVIVAGKAFLKVTAVDELQHYAEDAGMSEEEIAKITSVKKEFSFEASSVLLKVK